MPQNQSRIVSLFEESAQVKSHFARANADKILETAGKIIGALERGGKILLFGNGGSACDASHIAAEFVNRYAKERRALAAISLATDMANVTSISNDYDYSLIFARQIEALGRPGDVAVAISTSGNSANVLKGVERAKALGLLTIGFTGGNGGGLASAVDIPFIVPSNVTARIQETHITLGHVLCELIDEHFSRD